MAEVRAEMIANARVATAKAIVDSIEYKQLKNQKLGMMADTLMSTLTPNVKVEAKAPEPQVADAPHNTLPFPKIAADEGKPEAKKSA
jgi:hypothetical protein